MFLPQVPRVSSYHTNIALYAKHFGYPVLSPAIWGLQKFLHSQCAAILCPSPSTSRTLIDHNFPAEKIKIWHRGVDTQLFSNTKRHKELRQMWGAEDKTILLYVGRVSWEKNLKVLAQAYINIHRMRKDVHLVITGDGPARTELQALFNEEKARVTFTGYLEGMIPETRLMQVKIWRRHSLPAMLSYFLRSRKLSAKSYLKRKPPAYQSLHSKLKVFVTSSRTEERDGS